MLDYLQTAVIVLLIGILSFNMTYKNKIHIGEQKRFASLFLSGIILVFLIAVIIINRFNYSPFYLIPAGITCILLTYLLRNRIFIFSNRCKSCQSPLPFERILYYDSNKCEECDTKEEEK